MPTTPDEDAEVKRAIASSSLVVHDVKAPAPRKGVTEALRAVALIQATEGGRAHAAWLELANALAVALGEEPSVAAPPPELAPPLRELASGNAALAGPNQGVLRRASGSTQIAAPVASTGGRVVQTGPRTRR
jgi:hypothetical protein